MIQQPPTTSSRFSQEQQKRRRGLKRRLILALFVALIVLLSFTPLGFIHLIFLKATTIHIPALLGAFLLGPAAGLVLGASFGLCSLLNNSFYPGLLSFCFSPFIPLPGSDRGSLYALVICFLPRLILGLGAGLVGGRLNIQSGLLTTENRAGFFGKLRTKVPLSVLLSAALLTLLHSVLTLGLIYLGLAPALAQSRNLDPSAVLPWLLGLVAANGLPEALVATLLSALLYPVVRSAARRSALLPEAVVGCTHPAQARPKDVQ